MSETRQFTAEDYDHFADSYEDLAEMKPERVIRGWQQAAESERVLSELRDLASWHAISPSYESFWREVRAILGRVK